MELPEDHQGHHRHHHQDLQDLLGHQDDQETQDQLDPQELHHHHQEDHQDLSDQLDQLDHQGHQDPQDHPVPQDLEAHQEHQLLHHHHVHQSVQHSVYQLAHNTVAQQERRSKLTNLLWMGTRATDLTHRITTTNEENITILIYFDFEIRHLFYNLVCLTGINLVGNNLNNLITSSFPSFL